MIVGLIPVGVGLVFIATALRRIVAAGVLRVVRVRGGASSIRDLRSLMPRAKKPTLERVEEIEAAKLAQQQAAVETIPSAHERIAETIARAKK